MKNRLLLLAISLLPILGFGQLQYSQVKIYSNNAELNHLMELGITIDHGKHKTNEWFIAELSSLEIDILAAQDLTYEILIEDMSAYYLAHINDTYRGHEREDCPPIDGDTEYDPAVPDNFELGSMGGYFTYEEYLAELDAMRAAYPSLITEKAGIEGYETWEGRPIHWVRISDNPEIDEAEHEVLYTAIHHAREPMSLSQTIFYMWYLLENYGSDDEITYLVDHTEMYFVPMINADGYKYNHTTNPGGGGMHRKNRNPSVGTSNKGVDLNRNYSYHWNETGTSPSENGDTYAGSGPFSEPETQAIRSFCESHEFEFAFNAHSHGDLLLFPIGWAYEEYAEDHDYFQLYSDHMTIHNQYIAQKSSDLYPASGDSDDWMYIEDLDEKPEIFAITPEIGNSFWPSSSAIIPTCKEMIWTNKMLAHMSHVYGEIKDLEASKIDEMDGYFSYSLQRLGYEDGPMTISMTALEGIASLGTENIHDLALSEIKIDSIDYNLNPGIGFGDIIKYVIHTDNGLWTRHDTIIKTYNESIAVFFDDCTDLTNWSGDWNYTDEIFYSPDNCITDSPYDDTYGNNVEKEITLNESFDFSHATYANVNFRATWEIENDYDYVQFMVSVDEGDSWQPLCGKYTNMGVSPQDVDEPLYDGYQADWILEEIDLVDYIDFEDVRFKFRLITDGGLQMDGFYFDDFAVYTDAGKIDDTGISDLRVDHLQIYPNPTAAQLTIKLKNGSTFQSLSILNEVGQKINEVKGFTTTIDVSHLANGMYFIQIKGVDGALITERFTILR